MAQKEAMMQRDVTAVATTMDVATTGLGQTVQMLTDQVAVLSKRSRLNLVDVSQWCWQTECFPER